MPGELRLHIDFHTLGGYVAGVDETRDDGARDEIREVGLVALVLGVEHGNVETHPVVDQRRFQAEFVAFGRLGRQRHFLIGLHVEEGVVGGPLVALRIRRIDRHIFGYIELRPDAAGNACFLGRGRGRRAIRLHAGNRGGGGGRTAVVIRQIVVGVAQSDDAAQLLAEIQRSLAEQRRALG